MPKALFFTTGKHYLPESENLRALPAPAFRPGFTVTGIATERNTDDSGLIQDTQPLSMD